MSTSYLKDKPPSAKYKPSIKQEVFKKKIQSKIKYKDTSINYSPNRYVKEVKKDSP